MNHYNFVHKINDYYNEVGYNYCQKLNIKKEHNINYDHSIFIQALYNCTHTKLISIIIILSHQIHQLHFTKSMFCYWQYTVIIEA